MNTALINTNTNELSPIGIDTTRDLIVTSQYEAASGFVYQSGYRSIQGFRIEESVANGHSGLCFLSGIKIYHNEELLIERQYYKEGVIYTRDIVRREAEELLIENLRDTAKRNNVQIDNMEVARRQIAQILDLAYYKKSDEATMGLMKSWGLKLSPI